MKKLCNVMILILTLLGCVLFSACKDKYADLQMAFIASDGNPLEKIELVIDEQNPQMDKSSGSYIVKFLGIKSKDVGEVSIYVESESINTTISNKKVEDGQCSFTLKATSTGVGKLVAMHNSSGKTSKIDVVVKEKATHIELKTQNYMIAAGTEHRIDADVVLTKFVQKGIEKIEGGNDNVYFGVKSQSVSGVTTIRDEKTNLVVGFTVADDVANGNHIEIYPILRMDGYEANDEKYADKTIKLYFVQQLENLKLASPDEQYEDLDIIGIQEKPITLISNDTTIVNEKHRFNSLPVNVENTGWEIFYSLEVDNNGSTSVSVSKTNSEDSSAIVVAHNYSNSAEQITFKLNPKYPGNVRAIEKDIYIKSNNKPTDIYVYQQGKLLNEISDLENSLDDIIEIDIYNYYQGNSNGAKFNFELVDKSSMQDLKSMRIVINPAILNGQYEDAGKLVGVNPIFDKDGNQILTQKIGEIGNIPVNSRYNSNILEFYLNDMRALKFEVVFIEDAENSQYMLISEKITEQDYINIKYSEIKNENTIRLVAELETYYSGTEKYLEGIECVGKTLEFTGIDGVKGVDVGAGCLQYNAGKVEQLPYESGNISSGIHLYREQGLSNKEEPTYVVYLHSVMGVEGELSNSNFKITVSGGKDNPLKLWEFEGIGNIKFLGEQDLKEKVVNKSSMLIQNYNYQDKSLNGLVLIFDNNTDIGEYAITIEHASNNKPLKTIKCFVHEGADETDFGIDVETNDFTIKNLENPKDGYIYEGYECDYIVAKGDTVKLKIQVKPEIIQSGLLNNYFCSDILLNGTAADEFVTISIAENNVELVFNKASFNEGNTYYTINFGATFTAFKNIVKESADKDYVSNKFTFFVYEKVTENNLQISQEELSLYYEDLNPLDKKVIGIYNEGETKADLSLSFVENNNSIWNYVQEYSAGKKVNWYATSTTNDGAIKALVENDVLKLHFSKGQIDNDVFVVYAEITQFGQKYQKYCLVTLQKPILTTRLILDSPVERDSSGNYYIDMEVGKAFEVKATNYNPNGEVSHPGIILAVFNENNKVDTKTVFVRENEIHVYSNASAVSGLKLYIFSKDLLKDKQIEEGADTYTLNSNIDAMLNDLYLSGDGALSPYKDAFIAIDLHITDGINVPYEINSADDFWAIGEDHKKDKIFKVMTDIDLSNVTEKQIKLIEEFSGRIITDNDQTFNISGLKLDNNLKNFIQNFSGLMENLNFQVEYAYNYQEKAESGLGLIGENTGTLTNIGVEVSGEVTLNRQTNDEINFGALVAENNGNINISNVKTCIEGALTINGNTNVKFGAVAGKNTGLITGAFQGNTSASGEGEQEVLFIGDKKADGAIVNFNLTSKIKNQGVSIGLVCGVNEGSIKNAYVLGEINHNGYGNIGGVIGSNKHAVNYATFNLIDATTISFVSFTSFVWKMEKIKSAVQINLTEDLSDEELNYVGGIVGYDTNGSYNNCHYQILANTQGIVGGDYVGGVAGYSQDGWFKYCSVMSYNWDYANVAGISDEANADISGANVGGLIGKVYSTLKDGLGNDSAYKTGDNIIATSIINLSSVNAYLKATNGCAGLIADGNNSLIFNAYMMGKLKNGLDLIYDDCSTALTQTDLVTIYNVYVSVVEIKLTIPSPSFVIDAANGIDGWGYNQNLNGGYVFITKSSLTDPQEKIYPIYEVAPTSLSATVTASTSGHTKVEVEDDDINIVNLNYYDFILNINSATYTETYNALNEQFNTHKFKDLFNFRYFPTTLKNVQVKAMVEEGKENIISIVQDKLIVKGAGQCKLTFYSAINPNVKCEVVVNVTLPIGDEIVLSTDAEDESFALDQINIPKGSAKMLFVIAKGYKTYNGTPYEYRTSNDTQFTLVCDEEYREIYADYLTISNGSSTINLNEPFYISAINYDENAEFEFTLSSFISIKVGESEYKLDGEEIYLTIKTVQGATGVSLNHTSAIVYPNDVTKILAYIKTDVDLKDLDNINFMSYIQSLKINGESETIEEYISFVSSEYQENTSDKTKSIQIVEYCLDLTEFENKDKVSTMEVKFKAIETATATFTIIPQRINKIDISNYIVTGRESGNTAISQRDVLKQGEQGLIIIDMAPYNGYFDYLEITDITGGERILFTQVADIHGTRVSMDIETQNGLGKKLFKYDDLFDIDENKSSIYVYTMIDKNAFTSTHTIKVEAFLSNGTKLTENTIDVDVQMLPELEVTYLTPDRDPVKTFNQNNSAKDDTSIAYYVPFGTKTEFRVKEINATERMVVKSITVEGVSKSTSLFSDVDDNGIYELDTTEIIPGSTINITLSLKAKYSDGTTEETTLKLEFMVVDFVIYSITASPTTSTSPDVIYGNYGVDIKVEFSFEIGDVGYARNIADNEDIQEILSKINNDNNNTYLTLIELSDDDRPNIKLTGNTLHVTKDNKDTKIGLNYSLELVNNKWQLAEVEDAKIKNIQHVYSLNMVNRTDKLNMEVIKSEEDFLKMSGPGTNYILGVDLVLGTTTPYTPIDVDINVFDGNGHTITIKNFAQSKDQNAQFGLFKQVRAGMAVINLNVKYEGFGKISTNQSQTDIKVDEYYDLASSTSEVEYLSVLFGGITAVNNGVISNCSVLGDLALEATRIEQIGGDSSLQIDFNVGGLVGTNSETGYITNSRVSARIVAQANIGGIVHTNSGKIASTYFNAETDKGLIYAYKPAVATSAVTNVSGFVVNNASSGEISMSYVSVGTTSLKTGNTIGNMATKNPSAGFVYSNSGLIYDSYVSMEKFGLNQNEFAGFVYSGSGKINRCYTYINKGGATNNTYMFAPSTLRGIENCVEINDGIQDKPTGVLTLKSNQRHLIDEYKNLGFIFGDNQSGAVWTIGPSGCPQLVSTLTKVEFVNNGNLTEGVHSSTDEDGKIVYTTIKREENGSDTITEEYQNGNIKQKTTIYYGLRNYEIIAKNVYNEKTGQYEWVETKQTIELNHGSKENPYVIYSMLAYNVYFDSMQDYYSTEHYYILATDLKFDESYAEISTSNQTFKGNLQGNNMTISGIRLFSSNNLESLGLFKELVGSKNQTVVNSVRNLKLKPNQVNATKTDAVGTLAGIVENFNLYNITLDAPNLVVLGGNAVGGIAGIVRGKVDIDGLSSNVSVTSTRAISAYNYSIYNSIPSGYAKSANLTDVYYAGSVIGVIDAYSTSNSAGQTRALNATTYSKVRNISAHGNISLVGDTVGVAIGFVGENVYLENVQASTSGEIYAEQYAGGVVGENRGIIENVIFVSENDDVFNRTSSVIAGIVGLNLGGLVKNASTDANIISTSLNSVVGGIVGRNINGVVAESTFNGKAIGKYVGGIVGSDYSKQTLKNKTSGMSAIVENCYNSIPESQIKYIYDITVDSNDPKNIISNFANVKIGKDALDYWIENLSKFYSYDLRESGIEISAKSRVLGLLIGATDNAAKYDFLGQSVLDDTNGNGQKDDGETMKWEGVSYFSLDGDYLEFNNGIIANNSDKEKDVEISTEDGNKCEAKVFNINFTTQAVTYVLGVEVPALDTWMQDGYLDDYMLVFAPNSYRA